MVVDEPMRWHDVMPLGDLWIGELVGVVVAGHKVLVLNADGEVRAYEDRCPHLSSQLSDAINISASLPRRNMTQTPKEKDARSICR